MAETGLILLTLLVGGLCHFVPARLPFLLPFVFNPLAFGGCLLLGFWYWRGVRRLPPGARPSLLRRCFFSAAVLGVWFVLQTHFEYLAQHMFFLNRAQALVLGMVSPFLAGLAWPGEALKAGAPGWVSHAAAPVWLLLRWLSHPLVAVAVFLFFTDIWLVPAVHFAAMIDPTLYAVMTLSCVTAGVLFWHVVLDPRPTPPCRVSYIFRAGTGFLVMFPQIAVGAYIALTSRDLYSFYALCGRLFPSISPATDQLFGGMILWIPPGMMSVISLVVILNALRIAEEKAAQAMPVPPGAKIHEAKWTGR